MYETSMITTLLSGVHSILVQLLQKLVTLQAGRGHEGLNPITGNLGFKVIKRSETSKP